MITRRLALAGVAALALAGHAYAADKATLLASVPGMSFPFFVHMMGAFKAEAEKLGYNVIESDGQVSSPKQTADIEAALAKGVKGIVLSPNEVDAMAPALQEAVDAGVPVVTVDRRVPKVTGILAHVGADNVKGGEAQGNLVLKLFPNGAKIVNLQGQSGASPAIDRNKGLHNVLDNLGGPVNVANDLLEVQFTNAGIAAGRFLVNTTIGVAGIFDVATDWGLPERNRDFGETMGTYGVPPGPYLVLPLRGSTDVRDFAGNYLDGFASPLHFVRYDGSNYVGLMKSTLGSMDNRSANLVTYEDIERASVDYYATMRTLYTERRARLVEDRTVRTASLPDF